MTGMPLELTDQETLTNLKEIFVKAFKLSEKSGSDADIIALRGAENTYMSFIETHDIEKLILNRWALKLK